MLLCLHASKAVNLELGAPTYSVTLFKNNYHLPGGHETKNLLIKICLTYPTYINFGQFFMSVLAFSTSYQ